ncbi:MAG: ATP-grasp domain-containing protein [Halomonas sp.]|nr:ATP-grasp domain-containing protein [Halomonas sp.]MBR2513446.1 ATP-grasp domain-containing protein [Halomonas sp.]
MNILFTCAGRRNYLLHYFRDVLSGNGRILAADSNESAAAMVEADAAFLVPRVESPDYIPTLLTLCEQQKVGMLIALNDNELSILAEAKHSFMRIGTQVVVSSPGVIALTADKLATAELAKELGIATPTSYLHVDTALKAIERGELCFPLFVKPRWGSASLGVECVYDIDELNWAWQRGLRRLPRNSLQQYADRKDGLLIQSALSGQEYGLDVVNDLQGRYQTTFVKRKLGMRSGETDQAVTEDRPELVALGRRLGETLKHVGNLDCDVFLDAGRPYLLELNPRFGGGYPFSAAAGADVPSALLAWADGKAPPMHWDAIRHNVISSKCERIVSLDRSVAPVAEATPSAVETCNTFMNQFPLAAMAFYWR